MKKTILFFFYSFYISILSLQTLSESFQENNELSSLLFVKAGFVDLLDQLANWKIPSNSTSPPHCNWTGVFCNSEGSVFKIDISNMNLTGIVSPHIQDFSNLSVLNISCNGFSTSLPESLANLTRLQIIDVSQNNFVGDFPVGLGMASNLKFVNASTNNFEGFLPEDLGNATSLEILDFRGGYFEGSIPSSFKNLQKLKFLGLSGNNLSGEIPPELAQMSAIETIIIGYNAFEGSIPAEFGNLSNLQYLDLAVGNMSGAIPPELGKLKQLTTIYLYQNNFQGKIPAEFGNITSLVYVDLSDNQLSGEIPEEIAGLKNLQLLNLMCNQLSGTIPNKLGELPKLEVLELWKNTLTGPLPGNLGMNSPLQWLDVSTNSLSGQIPSGLCDYGNLTKLILFNNSLSGSIPIGLSNCSSLVRVRIQNNLLSGSIPVGFGSLLKLQRLELANNNLSGQFPGDIAHSLSLSFIDVSYNNLQSSLPSTIFSIPNLQNFMSSSNNLEGEIPDQFQDSPSLSVLDLSSNHFSGRIPDSIASCQKMVNLNLRNNHLTEGIPIPITTMFSLSILDLSNNSLTGKIPDSLGTSPALETLNISYNKLEGPVPHNAMFSTINRNDLVGNTGLCGGVLPSCSRIPTNTSRAKKVHIRHIIMGFVVGISTIIALGLIILATRWLYNKWFLCSGFFRDRFAKTNPQSPWRLVAFQRLNFSTTDILASIKESNVIGIGGSGIVYKAETHKPHSVVAVKKLWRTPETDIETGEQDELFTEVNLVGRLRHRNIVKLLGYLHNTSDVMMISEYMPNGNLGQALHGEHKVLIDWLSRYNVAVGVAHGLAYLHHDCKPAVIHRDVKANNILLDSNFEARIADFGLARTMMRKNETVSMVAGSYGYIAPEYGYSLKVDEKSDIYSFGVVLLELITGKRPIDPMFGESIDIVEWVRRKIKTKSVEESLDSEIGGDCKHVEEEMLLVLRIALVCTAKLPKDRPSMRDVITMLGEAKPRRKSVCNNWGSLSVSKDNNKPIFSNSPVIGLL